MLSLLKKQANSDGLVPINIPTLTPAASAPQAAASQPESASEPGLEKKAIDPLEGKLIHMTGYMEMGKKSMTAFTVSMDGQTFFEVTDKDLTAAATRGKGSPTAWGYWSFRAQKIGQ